VKLKIAGMLRSWAEWLDPSEPNYGYTYTFNGPNLLIGPSSNSTSARR
jgi:hypothetical protein